MISIFKHRNILSIVARLLMFTKSWKTNRKIIVIESDDWGSIRTSNVKSYFKLKDCGYDVDLSSYMLDALESDSDLIALYKSLEKYRNISGQNPKFTANIITANPDFEKIQMNNYSSYSYESVGKTCKESRNSKNVISLWKEGLKKNIFIPQLHAREHVRYWEWMNNLQHYDDETLKTFEMKMCGLPKAVSKSNTSFFKPIYVNDIILSKFNIDIEKLIVDGSELFTEIFGYKSKSTVAPNVAWTKTAESIWKKCEIDFIQGGFLQELHRTESIKYIPHYLGQKNKLGQIYLVRNCTFEPSKSSDKQYWKNTFKEIKRAFFFKTPAIISSHRVNYIGEIKKSNREHGLQQLEQLINAIILKYPNVEFMSSSELGELIRNKK